MIVDVPTAESLLETGYGWLNLAWEIAIRALDQNFEIEQQFRELDDAFDSSERDQYLKEFWSSKTFDLNNALSLVHQAAEILLKGRIANVSPFLLIANDDRSWPKLREGVVSFYDFKTLEAASLRKIADTVCSSQFDEETNRMFERLRKDRNRISHLDNNKFPVAVKNILVDVRELYSIFSPETSWFEFRRPRISKNFNPGDVDIWGHDLSFDFLLHETELTVDLLGPSEGKKFIGIDKRKKRFSCEKCKYECSKYYDGDALFVQFVAEDRLQCAICKSVYEPSYFPSIRKARKKPVV